MKLFLLAPRFAVCRLAPESVIPEWATGGGFVSITRTRDELSVVCEESLVPSELQSVRGWRALQVAGPLDFALTGILASIANPLADAGVSIFAISTFDTDYVLIKDADVERACGALRARGFSIDATP